MSRLKRDLYRRKLDRLLSRTSDEGFVRLIWAIDQLQSGEEAVARKYIQYPEEAATSDPSSRYYVHKWFLESLANEVLATRKYPVPEIGPYRMLNVSEFRVIATAANHLRALEEADDNVALDRKSIFDEMPRIGHKQFEWQMRNAVGSRFYRAAFLFGGEVCRGYFERTHGFQMSDFPLFGIALYANFRGQPAISRDTTFTDIGIANATRDRAFARLMLPLAEAQTKARAYRSGSGHSGYRKSVLREYPCLAFGEKGVRSPLCDLIIKRVTDGIYYDVVGAGGEFRDEFGRRFEQYCLDLFVENLPELGARAGNISYKASKRPMKTPDILVGSGEVTLVGECKANRMTFEAKFADDPLEAANAAYEALAHGVFQIWRFFSHCRRGFVPGVRIAANALGVVLTIDPWLIMSRRYPDILRMAKEKVSASHEEIIEADCKTVSFCYIDDLESLLSVATPTSLHDVFRAASEEERSGWHLVNLHRDLVCGPTFKRPYPFRDRVEKLLPWWSIAEKA